MTAYYNEINKDAAQWMRNLIEAGHIAPGYVDERSIEDVYPSDLRGFTQCHFFAGIGVWSYALRKAGWSDDRSVWTGSCPCQPFSAAGKGVGFSDERHLWPAFHHLIKECKPEYVLGEQVASKDADSWIDLVHTDMEALGYAFGAVPFPSAGAGGKDLRERLYWVANSNEHCGGRQANPADYKREEVNRSTDWIGRHSSLVNRSSTDCEWVACADGWSRPIEPGLCAVVDENPARVGCLRAYGNAINAVQAQTFIEAVMESI